jgi:Asp-tRNA(Asn)/Glu-tRNA(Gln) amidotransferase A subunit family amidase
MSLKLLLVMICGTTLRAASAQTPSRSFELLEATIPQIQAALTTGIVTSRDLLSMYLTRIEAYDKRGPALNSISVVNSKAFDEANALDAERRAGVVRGPLHGVPIILKDNYETIGMQTANGSLALAGWIPPDNAFQVKKLRAAGAIVIAKSNMHEFAAGVTTVGTLFGATRNPYALDRNPGGSSGGTGAAIAANFATVGMGSDTCGSIRIPAAQNSLVGIRGTQGLSSRSGIIPRSHTQDIGGPIGRSVTDVAIVLDATVGYDPTDSQTAASIGNIPKSYTEFLQLSGLRGVRIGVLTNLLAIDAEDTEVASVVRASVNETKSLGAEVVDVAIPNLEGLLKAGNGIIQQDFKFDFNAYLEAHPTAPVRSLEEVLALKKYHPSLQQNLTGSQMVKSLDTKEYLQLVVARRSLQETILKAMADNRLDAVAYPPIRRKANLIGEPQLGNTNCQLASISGLPSIVVPAGFTPDGLPVGLELLGREWSEPQLIKFAYAYEQATKHRRAPSSTPPLGH